MNIEKMLQAEIDNFAVIGYPALMQRFVVRNGRAMTPVKDVPLDVKRGQPKNCFMNATHLAFQGYQYVEGYAYAPNLPILIQHAWVIDTDGNVIDNTWERREGTQYFGVEFDIDVLTDEIHRTGVYGLLDTGMGINVDFLFRVDPDLKQLLNEFQQQHSRKFA